MIPAEEKDKAPQEQVAPVRKGSRYKGTYRMNPGHQIYELDLRTGIIGLATTEVYFDTKRNTKVNKLVERENCAYLPCLNKKNAERKFKAILEKAAKRQNVQ